MELWQSRCLACGAGPFTNVESVEPDRLVFASDLQLDVIVLSFAAGRFSLNDHRLPLFGSQTPLRQRDAHRTGGKEAVVPKPHFHSRPSWLAPDPDPKQVDNLRQNQTNAYKSQAPL